MLCKRSTEPATISRTRENKTSLADIRDQVMVVTIALASYACFPFFPCTVAADRM